MSEERWTPPNMDVTELQHCWIDGVHLVRMEIHDDHDGWWRTAWRPIEQVAERLEYLSELVGFLS